MAVLSDEKPRFIVNVHFNYEGFFCRVDYLNNDLEKVKSESYMLIKDSCFSKFKEMVL